MNALDTIDADLLPNSDLIKVLGGWSPDASDPRPLLLAAIRNRPGDFPGGRVPIQLIKEAA